MKWRIFQLIKSFIILILLFNTNNLFAQIGEVIKYKGSSSILNGSHKLDDPKEGLKISNDTSILTFDNTYVTIELKNPLSYIKIGSESKVSIKYEPSQKAYYLTLHKGYIKTLFKQSSMAFKMFVMTSNAKIELKENKMIAIYSPLIQRTSILNIKGPAIFYKKNQIGEETMLENMEYSYVEKYSDYPSSPTILSRVQQQEILNSFKIKENLKF